MVPRPLSSTDHPRIKLQVPVRCYRKSISACHMPHVFLGAGEGISPVSLSGFPPGRHFARRVPPELSHPPQPACRSPQSPGHRPGVRPRSHGHPPLLRRPCNHSLPSGSAQGSGRLSTSPGHGPSPQPQAAAQRQSQWTRGSVTLLPEPVC